MTDLSILLILAAVTILMVGYIVVCDRVGR